MARETTFRFFAVLTLVGVLVSARVFAQGEKPRATIFPIEGQPIVVQEFTINDETFYDAVRQGRQVKLPFGDLKEIRFLNPGKNYDAEVAFHDGRREAYLLQPASNITVISPHSIVSLSHSKVSRIAFSPLPPQQPPSDVKPAPQPRPDAPSGTEDRLILKSGENLNGQVQTNPFPLRTAYGTFSLEATQIASIEFDPARPTMAVVMLKNGDRLSGVVEVESIRVAMTSGEGSKFDVGKIKTIHFKR